MDEQISNRTSTQASTPEIVWDLPTRLTHWLIACSVVTSWLSMEVLEDTELHFYSGYTALTLIIFRVLWGAIGSTHSRFRSFPVSRAEITRYVNNDKQGGQSFRGHNPLGALSALVMITLLLVQAVTGLFAYDGYYVYGPMNHWLNPHQSAWITEAHEINFYLLCGFIALHIGAITYYALVTKNNLVPSMVHGRKANNTQDARQREHIAPLWLGGLALGLTALIVWGAITLLGR